MGKIEVHILSVFEEKGEGYTAVCEVRQARPSEKANTVC
jgi:hypothetical protein